MTRSSRQLRRAAAALGLTACLAVPTAVMASSTSTAGGVSQQAVQAVGADLAATLTAAEQDHWGLAPSSPSSPAATAQGRQDLETALDALAQSADAAAGQVEVTDVAVSIDRTSVRSAPDGTVTVTYDVHFARDVAELAAAEDWEEVIPYVVILSPAGEITSLEVQDRAADL